MLHAPHLYITYHVLMVIVLTSDIFYSGFNSALAIQVNTTRQDVRIAKEKLREEERQNREAQQSLEDWSKEVISFHSVEYLQFFLDIHSRRIQVEMQLEINCYDYISNTPQLNLGMRRSITFANTPHHNILNKMK